MKQVLRRAAASAWVRVGLVAAALVGAGIAVYFGGPEWGQVGDAFRAVRWEWVAFAIGLNLLSVVARSISWATIIDQAVPPPHPRFLHVFSAFSVGLLANATMPGRVGELARVAVLTRHMPRLRGLWATLVGTVFAHRVFDFVPAAFLVVWVLATAEIPHWAVTSLVVLFSIGAVLLVIAFMFARHHQRSHLESLDTTARRIVTMARHGLGVMRAPLSAAVAIFFQFIGWICQLFAVWMTMKAFSIDVDLSAAGLVLVLMNLAAIIPLWPGNVGLLQVAIATPLVGYGVPYAQGFAFGLGLQAIEASVGIGFGLIFLGREGLSYATLRRMPPAVDALEEEDEGEETAEDAVDAPDRAEALVD